MHIAPATVVVATTSLIPILTMIYAWRLNALWRARGRQAVEAKLAALGETPVSIEHVPLTALRATTGLSGAVAFRVLAWRPGGEEVQYEWAYELGVMFRRTQGLKRLAHGIWIPVT